MARKGEKMVEVGLRPWDGRKIRSEGRYVGRALCPLCGGEYAHLWSTDYAAWLECDNHNPQLCIRSNTDYARRLMLRIVVSPAPL